MEQFGNVITEEEFLELWESYNSDEDVQDLIDFLGLDEE